MALISKNQLKDRWGNKHNAAYVNIDNIKISKRTKRISFLLNFYGDEEKSKTEEPFLPIQCFITANQDDLENYQKDKSANAIFMTDGEFNELLQTLNPFYEKLYSESKKERTKEINEKYYEEEETQDPDNPEKTEKVQVQKLRKKQVTFSIINPENFIDG